LQAILPDPKEKDLMYRLNNTQRFQYLGSKGHASDWMLFEQHVSPFLSIDEMALSNGELYTIVTKLQKGFSLSIRLGDIYRTCTSKEQAFKRLAL
jgi:hypothetical protein